MSTRRPRFGSWTAALALLALGGCKDERPDLVRQTIGPAGGLISSHDDVLTLVFQPGALTRDHDIEIFPSEEPPLIFGPAYRVKPDIELEVDVEVTYRRVLPSNTDGVAVAAIRLDDYTGEMGYWRALPRLAIDEASGAVFASDSELSLYYGMLESGGGNTSVGTSGNDTGSMDTGGQTSDPTGGATSGPTSAGTGDTGDSTSDPTDPTTEGTTDPTGASCGDGSVDPGELCFVAMDFAMGGGPVDVATGDFDDDGDLDAATANGDGSVSVRLGDGGGGFGAEGNIALGMAPAALDAGDLDQAMGDDLVVVMGDDQLVLLQSLGDGTFNQIAAPITGQGPAEVLVVDVNDDTVPDILVANTTSATVSFFPFMGGIAGEVIYSTGSVGAPVGMAFGQFNQNADMFEDVFAIGGGNFSALPGDGTGLADSPVGGMIGSDLRRGVGGDFGGGAPGDAVIADFADGGVYVMLGNGEAIGFTSQDFYATGAGAVDVTVADVTGDGDVDIIVANSGADTVTVLEKTGGSSWGNPTDFAVAGGPSGIRSGDLNDDGVADIIVSCQGGNAITVLVSDP